MMTGDSKVTDDKKVREAIKYVLNHPYPRSLQDGVSPWSITNQPVTGPYPSAPASSFSGIVKLLTTPSYVPLAPTGTEGCPWSVVRIARTSPHKGVLWLVGRECVDQTDQEIIRYLQLHDHYTNIDMVLEHTTESDPGWRRISPSSRRGRRYRDPLSCTWESSSTIHKLLDWWITAQEENGATVTWDNTDDFPF